MDKIRIIDKRVKEKFMVDDIYLNGYAKLCGWKATLVYFSLCRHANINQYCFPSVKLMATEHSISRDVIMDGVKILIDWNIIEVKKNKGRNGWKNNSYTLLDKSVWKPKQYQVADSNTVKNLAVGDIAGSQKQLNGVAIGDIKETHKKGNTFKETHFANGEKEIMDIFYKINPTLNWENKNNWKATAELIKKFGLDETKVMAEMAVSIQGQPYAPTATTPYEMKEKLAKLKLYFQREKNNSLILKI